MYRSYFGLHDFPFGSGPDPRYLYLTPQVREALACLQYGIAARKGFIVMTGEVGTGKTTLLKTVLNTFCQDRVTSAFVFNPRLDVLDFLQFVLTDFGIPVASRTKSGMLLQLNQWLIERYRDRGLCVIIVDEAQNLSWELLEEIRLLTNLETSSEKLVQIVLSGQPEFEDTLRDPRVRQLRQRVGFWCKTRPLGVDQTKTYINERLRIAGAARPIFSDEAVELIYALSKGIPRLVNLLCEHGLISAYVDQVTPIPARVIEAVGADLDLVEHPIELSVGRPVLLPEDPTTVAATTCESSESHAPDLLTTINTPSPEPALTSRIVGLSSIAGRLDHNPPGPQGSTAVRSGRSRFSSFLRKTR